MDLGGEKHWRHVERKIHLSGDEPLIAICVEIGSHFSKFNHCGVRREGGDRGVIYRRNRGWGNGLPWDQVKLWLHGEFLIGQLAIPEWINFACEWLKRVRRTCGWTSGCRSRVAVRKGWFHHASSAYSKPRLAVSLNKPKVCSMPPLCQGAKPRRIALFEMLIAPFDRWLLWFHGFNGWYNDHSREGEVARIVIGECLNFCKCEAFM